MKIKSLLIGLLVFGFVFNMSAQTRTSKVTKRQKAQQKRINQGVKSGELTKKEAFKLQSQQARVQRTKKRAKADGVVTRKERANIHRKQNQTSKAIYRQKNDDQSRN